jgi:medium-chain acyl-[acyl-carrier-protein] hydrolase
MSRIISIEVFGIQLPDRGERFHEPQTKDLPLIVRSILEAMEPLSDLPCIFFGHSLGALIAFDVARALRRSGKRLPLHLFAAAHRAPDVLDLEPPIHLLPDAEFLQELRRLGGMVPEIMENRDLMDLLLPSLRADFAIHEMYAYTQEAPLACPITACGGAGDVEVSDSDLSGWERHTAADFELKYFPD